MYTAQACTLVEKQAAMRRQDNRGRVCDATAPMTTEKISERETVPQSRKMADVEMDIASRRMNNGNEHV